MRVDDIVRASLLQKLAYLLALARSQRLDANARQNAREIGLLAAITPDLAHDRRAGSQRHRLLLEHAQSSAYQTIAAVDCN